MAMWQPKRWTAAHREGRRRAAAGLLRAGDRSPGGIAPRLGVSRTAVTRWKQRREAGGRRGLRHHGAPGRPSHLTAARWRAPLRTLRRGAPAPGCATGRRPPRRIAPVSPRQGGSTAHFCSAGRALRARGRGPQQPVPRARERDDALVGAGPKRDWPRVKRGRAAQGALAFPDKTGHPSRARVGTTGAPVGQPAVRQRIRQRRAASRIAARVVPRDGPARPDARHFPGRVRGEPVIVARRDFRRRIGRPRAVLCARLNAHRATVVQASGGAPPGADPIEWRPTSAPALNPAALGKGAAKRELLNALPGSVAELRDPARRSFLRLGRRSAVSRRLSRHARLPVT
jgi:hypothetical protein